MFKRKQFQLVLCNQICKYIYYVYILVIFFFRKYVIMAFHIFLLFITYELVRFESINIIVMIVMIFIILNLLVIIYSQVLRHLIFGILIINIHHVIYVVYIRTNAFILLLVLQSLGLLQTEVIGNVVAMVDYCCYFNTVWYASSYQITVITEFKSVEFSRKS